MRIRKETSIRNQQNDGNTTHISKLALDVNGLISPIKRHRMSLNLKQNLSICYIQEMLLTKTDISLG
jgi:hypothetical protein